MKNKSFVFILAGFLFLLCQVQVGNASVVNRFVVAGESESYVVALNVPGGQGLLKGWSFGVYDYNGETKNGLNLLNDESGYQFKVIAENNNNNGKYFLEVYQGLTNVGEIPLGETPDFSFYFFDGNGYYSPTDIVAVESENNSWNFVYKLDDTQEMVVRGNYLKPVPLPATIMLLGSSLMGLLIVGNRKKG